MYDRTNLTGASSSAASSGGYPNQHAPPASPSTTVARGYNLHRSTASLGYNNHHHTNPARVQHEYQSGPRRHYTQHRPMSHRHPPTPASTDINDESDFYAVGNGNPNSGVNGPASSVASGPHHHHHRPHFNSAANSTVGYGDYDDSDLPTFDPRDDDVYSAGAAEGMADASEFPVDEEEIPDTEAEENAYFLGRAAPPPSRNPSPTPRNN